MDLLRLSVMVTYLHHGACLLIDAINPVGTIDSRVYKKIGEVFREAEPFEPYLSIGTHVYDVGLYFNMFAKMDNMENGKSVDDAVCDTAQPHEKAVMEAANSLRAHHIPYTVLNNWRLELLPNARVLVLSDVPFLNEKETAAIKEYIENGGNAYISGRTNPALIEEIFGVKFEGYTEHGITYISPTEEGLSVMRGEFTREYPLVMFERQAQYKGTPSGKIYGTMTLPYTIPNPRSSVISMPSDSRAEQKDLNDPMYRFVSIHSNPPGVFTDRPAMMETDFGKGRVFYSSLPIERAKREQHSDIFSGIIKRLLDEKPSVFASSDAPETVECILFGDNEKKIKLLGLVNIQESFHTIPVRDFTVSVYSEIPPKEVVVLPGRKNIPFRYENKYIQIYIDLINLYSMLLLQF
jgi:hypothetical protein